ncbi:protein of unknown function [Azospirillum baldaniorum]|uniref:Uncharacterized protein n=1 Tax=Azospirillum baldaniorum TaxID=1064539 RepID=A0A9P1JQN9_9PROT|nr:protein of unknown function [Azospirillum baldaniorum]
MRKGRPCGRGGIIGTPRKPGNTPFPPRFPIGKNPLDGWKCPALLARQGAHFANEHPHPTNESRRTKTPWPHAAN